MGEVAVGTRVVAFSHREGKRVYIFGKGAYEGDFDPEEAVGELADLCRMEGFKSPRIRLDDGQVVYGCECWWCEETDIEGELEGFEIVNVDIKDRRSEELEKKLYDVIL